MIKDKHHPIVHTTNIIYLKCYKHWQPLLFNQTNFLFNRSNSSNNRDNLASLREDFLSSRQIQFVIRDNHRALLAVTICLDLDSKKNSMENCG